MPFVFANLLRVVVAMYMQPSPSTSSGVGHQDSAAEVGGRRLEWLALGLAGFLLFAGVWPGWLLRICKEVLLRESL